MQQLKQASGKDKHAQTNQEHSQTSEQPRVYQVTRDGARDAWRILLQLLQNAEFVAVDLEFSGYSRDPRLSAGNAEERYQALRQDVSKRAILSLGIAVFCKAPPNHDTQQSRSSGSVVDSKISHDGTRTFTTTITALDDHSTHTTNQNTNNKNNHAGKDDQRASYLVHCFDFLMKCEDDFMMATDAGAFLVQHEFDFNRMFREGIPYTRAASDKVISSALDVENEKIERLRAQLADENATQNNNNNNNNNINININNNSHEDDDAESSDHPELRITDAEQHRKPNHSKNSLHVFPKISKKKKKKLKKMLYESLEKKRKIEMDWKPLPAGLLSRIGTKPLIVHNGFVDLLFLYSAFQAPPPSTLQQFLNAMVSVVPNIFDTKYMADSHFHEKITYLAYLYEKSVCLNETENLVHFRNGTIDVSPHILAPPMQIPPEKKPELCEQYSRYGHCPAGIYCAFSHNVRNIVERDLDVTKLIPQDSVGKSRKSKISSQQEVSKNAIKRCDTPDDSGTHDLNNENISHTAGFDAFATGLIYSRFKEQMDDHALETTRNKINLMSKSHSVTFAKSDFCG